jgi:ATP-dependent helicase/nuclease subunit A
MSKTGTQSPPDHEQRRRIVTELDRTMLVEAAAGTGKTTSMVDRMVGLLATGKAAVDSIAAVTFTRKAAAELRARFQVELERAARGDSRAEWSDEPRAKLREALGRIERCFIGTIHSFCARLLRERPVEADVDVGFEELDDAADARLREQAWAEHVAELYATGASVLDRLAEVGLEIGSLRGSFLEFAEYPDVEEWPAPETALPDVSGPLDRLRQFATHMEQLAAGFPRNPGADKLMPLYRQIPRRLRHTRADIVAEVMELFELLREFETGDLTQRNWPGGREQAKAELERWNGFAVEIALPLVRVWRARRYTVVMQAIGPARTVYDRLRRETRCLNYQDLLLRSARLLRDNPEVRAYFRERFSHLLVDEFQDTDPIQAEVLLLLAADDPHETRWRKCRPVPGSLFVVGDPKQSIYRFRRADIVTYNQVREIIERNGGAVVHLTANFRTIEPVVHWVNRVFEPQFPAQATSHSPPYERFQVGRVEGSDGDLKGLRVIRTPREIKGNAAADFDAGLIARTIRAALDQGQPVPRAKREIAQGIAPRVAPGDFLIITRNTPRLSVYARELQKQGIPHVVTGGSALNEVPELALLQVALRALVEPHNPVALVAALRSALFGVSDPQLLQYKNAGGQFSFRASLPGKLPAEDAQVIGDAFARLRQYATWLAKLPPVAALERMAADLGLLAQAAVRPGGDVQAGSLAKAIEVLRAAQAGNWTVADLADHLAELVSDEPDEKRDGIAARPLQVPAVRVMNLHKAKGLEAPVVFLADPCGDREHTVELHIDRSGDRVRGYLAIYGELVGYTRPLLAHPLDWDTLAAEEQRFADAEKLRLLYVAATRAGAQLTVTLRDSYAGSNPWNFFATHLQDAPALADPGPPTAVPALEEITLDDETVARACDAIGRRWETILQPTYATAAAKSLALGERAMPVAAGEHGTEWGTVIHLLLQTAMQDPKADLDALARAALAEQGLDASLTGSALATVRSVMQSALWKRAMKSPRRFVEVPFQILHTPANAPALPTIVRGVMDLVFRETDGWVIADYKTDDPRGRPIEALVAEYRPQLQMYAEAWTKMVSEPVKETGLYFTSNGEYRAL